MAISKIPVIPASLTRIELLEATETVPASGNKLYHIQCTDIPGYTPVAISGFYTSQTGASSMTVYRFSVETVTPTGGTPYKEATLGLRNPLTEDKAIKAHVFVLYVRDL